VFLHSIETLRYNTQLVTLRPERRCEFGYAQVVWASYGFTLVRGMEPRGFWNSWRPTHPSRKNKDPARVGHPGIPQGLKPRASSCSNVRDKSLTYRKWLRSRFVELPRVLAFQIRQIPPRRPGGVAFPLLDCCRWCRLRSRGCWMRCRWSSWLEPGRGCSMQNRLHRMCWPVARLLK
jgi:hypothetical protein